MPHRESLLDSKIQEHRGQYGLYDSRTGLRPLSQVSSIRWETSTEAEGENKNFADTQLQPEKQFCSQLHMKSGLETKLVDKYVY